MSDGIEVFRVPKSTGTHADVFAVVGLADLLASGPAAGNVRIAEREADFEVRCVRPLSETDLASIPQAPGYPFLKANEGVRIPRHVKDVVDYRAEKAKADRKKQAKPKRRTGRRAVDSETQQLVQEEELRDDWRLLQVLNTLQGDETSNKIYDTIVSREPATFRGEIAAALRALHRGGATNVPWKAKSVQLFTPVAAKGYGRLKPDSTDRNDQTKEQWTDPFVEWLRYRGYFRAACPFFQGPKAEHVRLLCLIPHDISIRALESVARKLRESGVYGGPPKVDALAVLRLAELLIHHSEEYHDLAAEVFPGLSLRGKSPARVISGVMVTHYQSLGNAKAVSAMSTIALPSWVHIENRQDAADWLAVLDEHQRVVRGLQDDHSDEIGLLLAYRRFLERRGATAVWALLEFMERYGAFVVRANGSRQNGRTRWMTRFTDDHFGRVLMGTDEKLLEIINNTGFESVARAVRQATVTSQNKRARGEDVWREVRYALLHDLQRTRKIPGTAFIECVMEFVSRYNYENARRRETTRNPKAAPANVSDEELKSFIALVDRYGAPMVGALLAAYASCKEKWEPEEADTEKTTEGGQAREN